MAGFPFNPSTMPSQQSQPSSPFANLSSSTSSPFPASTTTTPPALGFSRFSNPSSTTSTQKASSSPFSSVSAPLVASSPSTTGFSSGFSKFPISSSGYASSSLPSSFPSVPGAAASGSTTSASAPPSFLGISFTAAASTASAAAPAHSGLFSSIPNSSSSLFSTSKQAFSTGSSSTFSISTASIAATVASPLVPAAKSSEALSSATSLTTPAGSHSAFQSSCGLKSTTPAITMISSPTMVIPTSLGFAAYSAPSIASTPTITGVVTPAVSPTPTLTPALFTSQAGNSSSTPSIPVCGVTTSLTAYASASAGSSTAMSALTSHPSPTQAAAATSASLPQSVTSAGISAEPQVKSEDMQIVEDDAAVLDDTKYPDANQLFEGGLHIGATLKGDYVEVGGFHVQKCHEQLYTCIWKKYGHIATSAVLCDAYEGLAAVTAEFLVTVEDMYRRPLSEVTPAIMEKWGKKMKLAKNLKWNISWLEDRLIKMNELTAQQNDFYKKLANCATLLAEDGIACSAAQVVVAELEKKLADATKHLSELHDQRGRHFMEKEYFSSQIREQIAANHRSLLCDLFK